MRLLDLFCGRFGWSKAFAARGWECVGVDLTAPAEVPEGCTFMQADVLSITAEWIIEQGFDFICASSPCEEFSVHGMKCFHPNPKHPEMGLKLFNHTHAICGASGLPYVMENVRAAQKFVGNAVNHCGPFYLWGNSVPAILPQGIRKGVRLGKSGFTGEAQREWRKKNDPTWNPRKSKARQEATSLVAQIPAELSSCIADYAERITEMSTPEFSSKLFKVGNYQRVSQLN